MPDNTQSKNCTYKDIREKGPKCLQSLHDDTPVVLLPIPYGEVIWSYDGVASERISKYKNHTGFVLSGVAELYDISKYDQIVAYRPIRLLTQSNIFGEFALLDDYVFNLTPENKVGSNGLPRERWQLISGRRCYLLKQRIASNFRSKLYQLDPAHDDGNEDLDLPEEKGAYELFNLLKSFGDKMQQTEIALIDLTQLIRKNTTLRLDLFEYGWEQVKIYRDCLNSFNLSHILEVRNTAIKTAKILAKKSSAATKWEAIVPLFSDAVFDALNSPLRNEPTFQNIKQDHLPVEVTQQLEKWGISCPISNILSTSLEHEGEFYIPLGVHNYLINLYLNDSHIAEDINIVFGKNFVAPTKEKSLRNPREFYEVLANKLIAGFLTSHVNYPWKVTCISVDGINRPMLLMHFTAKS